MLHKPTKTLLLVNAIENFTDRTANVNWQVKACRRLVLRILGEPKPAHDCRFGWSDKFAAHIALIEIIGWDFEMGSPA
jgi:hypothetical protein